MTLLAVGVLGGALFVANTVGSQESPGPASTAASNTAATAADAPPASAPPAAPAGEAPAEPAATGHELDLSGVEVAGAAPDAPDAEEADEAEDAPAEPPAEEEPAAAESTFAGESRDGAVTVAIAVNGNDAAAVITDGGTEIVLEGSATANGLALKDRTGKIKLDGDNPDDTFTGSITLNGERLRYTATATSVAEAKADGRTDVADAAKRVGQ
jgi:hypothetical protein